MSEEPELFDAGVFFQNIPGHRNDVMVILRYLSDLADAKKDDADYLEWVKAVCYAAIVEAERLEKPTRRFNFEESAHTLSPSPLITQSELAHGIEDSPEIS